LPACEKPIALLLKTLMKPALLLVDPGEVGIDEEGGQAWTLIE